MSDLHFITMYNGKVYYKYTKLVSKNEYVIAFIIETNALEEYIDSNRRYLYNFSVIYITNYGRFINVSRYPRYEHYNNYSFNNKEDSQIFIKDKKY